jgi:hypothetical protein
MTPTRASVRRPMISSMTWHDPDNYPSITLQFLQRINPTSGVRRDWVRRPSECNQASFPRWRKAWDSTSRRNPYRIEHPPSWYAPGPMSELAMSLYKERVTLQQQRRK